MTFKPHYILVFGLTIFCSAQNTKDVGFIRDQPYLKYAKHVNCDSISGITIEDRICLNIELRQVDSLMLTKFNEVLNMIESDSLKYVFRKHQTNWEAERKSISMLQSDGYENSAEAIVYMYYMIKATEIRILALNQILEKNY